MSPLVKKLVRYAVKTNINFANLRRYDSAQKLGGPDMRGFTPHLREVGLYYNQKVSLESLAKKKGLNQSDKWLLHDICHIVFYDYCTLHLGPELWSDSQRFLECHLGSEVFAVLFLDYICLLGSGNETLAIDMTPAQWRKLSHKEPQWPKISSFEFSKWLCENYLTGNLGWANDVSLKVKDDPAFNKWLGHELRYGSKQRVYVNWWWSDLNNQRPKKNSVIVENSEICYAIWDLIQIFGSSSNKLFQEFIAQVNQKLQKSNIENIFSQFLKYSSRPKWPDFRFTDILSVSPEEIILHLKRAKKPNSSALFLCYQCLSLEKSNAKWGKLFKQVCNDASRNAIHQKDWENLIKTSLKVVENAKWNIRPDRLACFFLP